MEINPALTAINFAVLGRSPIKQQDFLVPQVCSSVVTKPPLHFFSSTKYFLQILNHLGEEVEQYLPSFKHSV